MLNIKRLDCFIRVCEIGSITRAAVELNISQPALGLQIRGLEHEFGKELLIRSSHGVKLTAEGEVVLEWARSIRSQANDVRRRLHDMADTGATSLTVALTSSFTDLMSAQLIATAQASCPEVHLKIVEGLSHSIAEWVEDKQVDIGVASGLFETSSVNYAPAVVQRMFYLCKRGGATGPIRFADVLQLPLALPTKHDSIHQVIEEAAGLINVPLVGVCETASTHASLNLARSGIAGSIGPFASTVGRWSEDLDVRLITDPIIERTFYILTSASRSATHAEQQILSIIRRMMNQLFDDGNPEAPYRPVSNVAAKAAHRIALVRGDV